MVGRWGGQGLSQKAGTHPQELGVGKQLGQVAGGDGGQRALQRGLLS